MRKTKLFFMFMMVAFVSVLPAGAQVTAVLERIDAHRNALTSLRANLKMVKYDFFLKESEISEGTLVYAKKTNKREMMLRIDWKTPRVAILSIASGKYVAYNPHTNQVFTGAATSNEVAKRGGSALAFMHMSKMELKTNYNPPLLDKEMLSGNVATWHLTFTPKGQSDFLSAEIWVDVDGMIVQARITKKSKDQDLFRLANIEKNPSLNSAQFIVALPSNVKKIVG